MSGEKILKPKRFSKNPTILSKLSAIPKPRIVPRAVPTTPMMPPSMIKILKIPFEGVPIDFSMAISLFFSITTIMSVEMIFKAATNTISTRMINIAIFSSFRADIGHGIVILIHSGIKDPDDTKTLHLGHHSHGRHGAKRRDHLNRIVERNTEMLG